MHKYIIRLLLSIAVIFLVSCSRAYYVPPTEPPLATVSFSNMSSELPDVYIIIDCKSHPLDSSLFERKRPDDTSRHKTPVPAGKMISFRYDYNWLISENTQLVTSGASFGSRIETQKTKQASTCSSLVSFMPEPDRHYEVYFGLVADKCTIKVAESLRVPGGGKKLGSVQQSDSNECRK